jgi:phosphatidate cytidylyltransferase
MEALDRSRSGLVSAPHPIEFSAVNPLNPLLDTRKPEGELPIREHSNSQEAEQVKKRQNVVTRTLWTFIMIGGFIGTLVSV